MELLQLQLLFMGIIFICATFAGFTPLLLGKFFNRLFSLSTETKSRLLSDASCFGAGVFLFVCFLGLLPAADRKFHAVLENLEDSEFSEFPWGFFVVTCGFLVIFTIDKVVHALDDSKNRRKSTNDTRNSLNRTSVASGSLLRRENSNSYAENNSDLGSKRSPLNYECHIEACGIFEENHGGVPSSLMFLVALGLHSVFEGIAIGLQDSRDKILEYSIAILLHEIVMALTFGLEVSKSPTLKKSRKLTYVFIFTSSIPIGIAIGIGLQNVPSENRELISAIIEAFATGIFLHVIFIEILANEFPHFQFDRHKCRLLTLPAQILQPPQSTSEICLIIEKIICICSGFSLLILMNVFLHGHSH